MTKPRQQLKLRHQQLRHQPSTLDPYILVSKETGEAISLPYTTVDFRGDPITVVSFAQPLHAASTGRIYTSDGCEFYPSVAGLAVIPEADYIAAQEGASAGSNCAKPGSDGAGR